MRHLLLKDFLVLRNIILFVVAWWLFILVRSSEPTEAMFLIPLPLILYGPALDDRHKTESLYCSLPVKRHHIVLGRYLFAVVIIISVSLLTLALFGLKNTIFADGVDNPSYWKTAVMIHFFLTLFISILYPFYFKFGAQLELAKGKAIAAVLGIIGLLALIPVAATYLNIKLSVTPQSTVYGGLIAAAILAVSALWSIKIFKRREL
jgi:ABC-2 type transport system permease protein